MIGRFRGRSIRQKLTWVVMLASSVALLSASTGFLIYEYYASRQGLVHRLAKDAEMVGFSSVAALVFADPQAATQILAGLRADPVVIEAAIYDEGGQLFATYRVEPVGGSLIPAVAEPVGHRFGGDDLVLTRAIPFEERSIGSVFIRAGLTEMGRRVWNYAGIGLLVALVSFAAALVISSRFQKAISCPIQHLAETAQVVSRNQDYTIRARVQAHDELGRLTQTFNEMLSQIQRQNSDLKRTAEVLAEQTRELERSNAELEQFAYVASHDLQEPLRAIAGCVQLLQARYGGQLDQRADELIGHSVDAATRMQTLISDLLSLSRLGTREKPFVPTACRTALDRALDNLRVAIEESGARVTSDELPTVMAEAMQITQLFQNLIGNAIKFRGEEPPRIHLRAAREGDDWLFAVRDNGIGFDPAYSERIFGVFQRLHNRTRYPGTGIGLAICKKIVERHGGAIHVESEPGRGSTFYFTLRSQEVAHASEGRVPTG